MKHLNLELEKLEQRIAPHGCRGGSNGSKSGGSKSGGSKSHGSNGSKGSKGSKCR